MKKSNKTGFFIALAFIVVVIGLLGYRNFFSKPGTGEGDIRVPCIGLNEDYHIHSQVKIIANGGEVKVPSNIGIGLLGCTRVLHTHDETGTIHVEDDHYAPYTLGDFFSVWQKPFNQNQILEYVRDENREIVMTVNGQPSTEFENLTLQDEQSIVIEYREIKN